VSGIEDQLGEENLVASLVDLIERVRAGNNTCKEVALSLPGTDTLSEDRVPSDGKAKLKNGWAGSTDARFVPLSET